MGEVRVLAETLGTPRPGVGRGLDRYPPVPWVPVSVRRNPDAGTAEDGESTTGGRYPGRDDVLPNPRVSKRRVRKPYRGPVSVPVSPGWTASVEREIEDSG